MFARAGWRVALVEAKRIARGSTAASTALLMQEPDTDFVDLAAQYGTRRARRFWQLSQHATRQFIRTLRQLDVGSALSECDSIYYAASTRAVGQLRLEFDRRRAAAIRSQWLDRSAVRQSTGIAADAAIRTRGNGQVDPYRACLAFARAAQAEGALLFENSQVDRIEAGHRNVTITTNGGQLLADRVVVATGYATPFFKPLEAHFRVMNTYVSASRPTTIQERRAIGFGNVMLWDTSRPYYYARWTPDHRLLIGGGDRRYVAGQPRIRAFRERIDAVRRHFEQLWPPLSRVDWEFAWEGLFATTPDGLPYIGEHPEYPRHLFALGYGGNGMTFGFLAARLLVDHYRHDWHDSDHRQASGRRRFRDFRLFAFDR